MFNFFKGKAKTNFLTADIHSHLIPKLDDGVQSVEESIEIIRHLVSHGITKIVTTPHIIHDYYPNTPDTISQNFQELKKVVQQSNINVELEAAAEYMLDENFISMIDDKHELLTFGDSFILVETPFINKPIQLEDVMFQLKSLGYNPILAHPERYIYIQENFSLAKQLVDQGIMLQLNILSLVGYYSKIAQKTAEYLISNNLVHFLGSDLHKPKQLAAFDKSIRSANFQKCRQLFLYNSTL